MVFRTSWRLARPGLRYKSLCESRSRVFINSALRESFPAAWTAGQLVDHRRGGLSLRGRVFRRNIPYVDSILDVSTHLSRSAGAVVAYTGTTQSTRR